MMAERRRPLTPRVKRRVLGRCVQLDMNLERCPKMALYKGMYHGDPEIYFHLSDDRDDARAVEVRMCEKHAKMARLDILGKKGR